MNGHEPTIRRPMTADASLLMSLLMALTPVAPLGAQSDLEDPPKWEIALSASWSWDRGPTLDDSELEVLGLQVERAVSDHLVPWFSLRWDAVYDGCALIDPECTIGGPSAYAGLNLRGGPVGGLAPYLAAGLGVLRWTDGEVDAMWMIRPGISVVGLGAVRPRIEFGLERYLDLGLTVGVGVAF